MPPLAFGFFEGGDGFGAEGGLGFEGLEGAIVGYPTHNNTVLFEL